VSVERLVIAPPLGSQSSVVAAGWAPVRAPYLELRSSLADAEQRLNTGAVDALAQRWRRVADAVDEETGMDAVNGLLAVVIEGWRLARGPDRWHIVLVGAPQVAATDVAAARALVLLIESAGWSRVKRCDRPACSRVFLDWTNGASRRGCRIHPSRPCR